MPKVLDLGCCKMSILLGLRVWGAGFMFQRTILKTPGGLDVGFYYAAGVLKGGVGV